jgi:hypothetical protein
MPKKPHLIREPIQVYLDGRDRALLDDLSKREKLPRSEILRMALRRLGASVAEAPGDGIGALTGALSGTAAPRDLAERHDEFLYAPSAKRKRGTR